MSEHEIGRILADIGEESERTKDVSYPAGTTFAHRSDSVVYSLRLRAVDLEQIKQLSETNGMPVSVMMRDWVVQGLAADRDLTLAESIDRLAAELRRLRRLAHVEP